MTATAIDQKIQRDADRRLQQARATGKQSVIDAAEAAWAEVQLALLLMKGMN